MDLPNSPENMSDSSDSPAGSTTWSINTRNNQIQIQSKSSCGGTYGSGESDDESDVDNPNYLKDLCSGVTKKIKVKNETIEIYRRMLISTNLQLVKIDAAHQRKLRRLLILGGCNNKAFQHGVAKDGIVGLQFGEENGRDPLLLFPEEIWTMILDYVTDVKDLRSCSKTCVLFEEILGETKQQWLFGKVFPYLFNTLRRRDILNCRKVCKQWSLSIDIFLEKYYTMITPDKCTTAEEVEKNLDEPDITLKSFRFEYHYSIPFPLQDDMDSSDSSSDSDSTTSSQESINRSHDNVRAAMKLHERNPFIGRSVTIEEDSADFEHIEAQAQNRTFVSDSKQFLQDFGQHIWHLSICCNMDIQTPLDLYNVIHQSLVECKTLKSLCIEASLNWRLRRSITLATLNLMPAPIDCPHLSSLQVDVDDQRIFVIQDKLVTKFSDQLKRLDVQFWNADLYVTCNWSNLRELQVHKGVSEELLCSLMQTKAPSLRKLSVVLNGRGPYLETLIQLTNHFRKLDYLDLKFESRFGGISEEELADLPPGLTSSSSLTTLELTSSVTEVSYSFLICFPFVKRVIIRHGHWTNYNVLDAAAPYLKELGDNKEDKFKKELVKVSKYLERYGERHRMYKSNLWEMLPFLQILELQNARYVPAKRCVFTRRGYEYFKR